MVGPAGWAIARGVVRERWRLLLALVVIGGLAGGVTLAAFASASRGRSAPSRLEAAFRSPEVSVFTLPFLSGAERVAILEGLLAEAGIEDAELSAGAILLTVAEAPSSTPFMLSGVDIVPGPHSEPFLLEGRRARTSHEIELNEGSSRRFGAGIGDQVTISWYPASDLEVLGGGGRPEPAGSRAMTVTGIVRYPFDLVEDARAEDGTIFIGNQQAANLAPAFWDELGPDLAAYGLLAQIDPSEVELEQLLEAAADEEAVLVQQGAGTDDDSLDGARSAARIEASAIALVAAVFGIGIAAFLGLAAAQVANLSAADRRVLAQLGVTRHDVVRSASLLGPTLGATTAAIAVATAIWLSRWAPVGFAHRAEIDLGSDVDLVVLLPGAAAISAVLTIAVLLGAVRTIRREPAPAGEVGRDRTRAVGPLGAVIARRLIVHGATGQRGGTVRAGFVVTIVGAAAVVGVVCVATSLDRVAHTPELQGWNWDLVVGNYSQGETAEAGAAALRTDPDVDAFAGFSSDVLTIDGTEQLVAAMDPEVGPVLLDGRSPASADEVAMGTATLRDLDSQIGDDVHVVDPRTGDELAFEIVGTVVPPAPMADGMSLDEGVVLTFAGFDRAAGNEAGSLAPFVHLVRLRPGADRDEVRARLQRDFPGTVNTSAVSSDIRSLRRMQGLPYALAAALGAIGLGAVAVDLATITRRRQRELALLRSLGFTRPQAASVVMWQATMIALLALVVSLPIGVVVGRVLWSLVADVIGTTETASVPTSALAVGSVACVLVANVLALGPAIRANRNRTATVLRAD